MVDKGNNSQDDDNRYFSKLKREDPEELKDIAEEGGEQSGGKFEKGSERAKEAGKKGGKN